MLSLIHSLHSEIKQKVIQNKTHPTEKRKPFPCQVRIPGPPYVIPTPIILIPVGPFTKSTHSVNAALSKIIFIELYSSSSTVNAVFYIIFPFPVISFVVITLVSFKSLDLNFEF